MSISTQKIVNQDNSTNNNPLISVITVVFNGVATIRQTIESVVGQVGRDVEYIIIDGGSTDGTIEIIREYESFITYWVSEPDRGIYDAMNKGVQLARGQFVLHLNEGDCLVFIPKDTLRKLPFNTACAAFSVQLSGGSCFVPTAGLALNFHNTIHHQGCFYNRIVMGKYDLKYKVFSDFDMNLRLKKSGLPIVVEKNVVVSYHDEGGVSNTTKRFGEIYQIVHKVRGVFWLSVSFFYFKLRGAARRIGLL